jgi:L-lactate dehydrogenase complex protein LldG
MVLQKPEKEKMSSRNNILGSLKINAAPAHPLPRFEQPEVTFGNHLEKLKNVLSAIGGTVIEAESWQAIAREIETKFALLSPRVLNLMSELTPFIESSIDADPRQLENVTVAVLKGKFAVAESGAVWITEEAMGDRVLPFICEHLVLVVSTDAIFPTLHQAYDTIGQSDHSFGTFIAGPSKTADIEQSLVLGAHGPKSLTLFLIRD